MSEDIDPDALRDDVLQAIDSVYAEHGELATQDDVQEAVKGVFLAHGVDS